MLAKCFWLIAIPTAFPTPCPSGPVATSIPSVEISGWPGVFEFIFLKFNKSSFVMFISKRFITA